MKRKVTNRNPLYRKYSVLIHDLSEFYFAYRITVLGVCVE
jgi:hypothetical protein